MLKQVLQKIDKEISNSVQNNFINKENQLQDIISGDKYTVVCDFKVAGITSEFVVASETTQNIDLFEIFCLSP